MYELLTWAFSWKAQVSRFYPIAASTALANRMIHDTGYFTR
jgi:hypothetical protein